MGTQWRNRVWALLDEVIEVDPQYAQAHFLRGMLFDEGGDLVRAAICYRRAVEVDNLYLEAMRHLALVYIELDDEDRAREIVERALQIETNAERKQALRELVAEGVRSEGAVNGGRGLEGVDSDVGPAAAVTGNRAPGRDAFVE